MTVQFVRAILGAVRTDCDFFLAGPIGRFRAEWRGVRWRGLLVAALDGLMTAALGLAGCAAALGLLAAVRG